MQRPVLDPAIVIRPGTNITDVWERFEVFEALHHNITICNPMTSVELDEVIDAANMAGQQVVDYACGSGESLFRALEAGAASGVGVDLSPWMIAAAARTSHERDPDRRLTWVLGEASDYEPSHATGVAICIGAEWIWHDFGGTVSALARRLDPGGVAIIGAARLHHLADPTAVAAQRGAVETVDDQLALLRSRGFEPIHRVDPNDDGWDQYLAKTATAVGQWAERNPGGRSDQWIEEQADWQQARERDREVIGWSVWIARRTATSP